MFFKIAQSFDGVCSVTLSKASTRSCLLFFLAGPVNFSKGSKINCLSNEQTARKEIVLFLVSQLPFSFNKTTFWQPFCLSDQNTSLATSHLTSCNQKLPTHALFLYDYLLQGWALFSDSAWSFKAATTVRNIRVKASKKILCFSFRVEKSLPFLLHAAKRFNIETDFKSPWKIHCIRKCCSLLLLKISHFQAIST